MNFNDNTDIKLQYVMQLKNSNLKSYIRISAKKWSMSLLTVFLQKKLFRHYRFQKSRICSKKDNENPSFDR